MERFVEDLKKNHCEVLSLQFVNENAAVLRVKPPVSSQSIGAHDVQTLPNHPLFMLQLRQNTTIEYEEITPGVFEVRIENPRKPFSEEALRKIADNQRISFLSQTNGLKSLKRQKK